MNKNKKKPDQLVKSLDRALNILEELVNRNEPLGITEISKYTNYHKSTVYRLVDTLCYRGYLTQDFETGKYKVGMKIFELGSKVINNLDLRSRVKPFLKEIEEKTAETVHLGVLDSTKVVYIDKVESRRTIRMSSNIGSRTYTHSTGLGKATLAFLPEEKIDQIIEEEGLPEFTENTITEKEALKNELEEIRKNGFAIDEEENEAGIICVAAPIFDYNDNITAAISISGPANRMTNNKKNEIKKIAKEYSKRISRALGQRSEK